MTNNFNKQLLKLSHSFLRQLPTAIAEIEFIWRDICDKDWSQEQWYEVQKQFIGIKQNCNVFNYQELNDSLKELIYIFKKINSQKKCMPLQKTQVHVYIGEIKRKILSKIESLEEVEIENHHLQDHGEDYTTVFIYQNTPEVTNLDIEKNLNCKVFNCEKDLLESLELYIPRCVVFNILDAKEDFPIAEKIAQNKIIKNCTIPTLFIIESSHFALQLKIAKIGSVALTKPLDSEKLQQAIEELCPEKKAIPRILVVDSDTACATFYSLLLKTFGLKTEAATDHQQAITSVISFKPDIILMDLHFGDNDAIFIAREIREIRQHKNTPIIFISSETQTDKQFQAMQYGDDFITKPVSADILVKLIRVWLQFKDSKVQHSSVRLNRQKFISQVNSKEQEVKKAQSTLVDLEIKIKQLEKEIGDIKQLPETSDIPRNTIIPGTKGNSYTIEEVMGRGGMSVTYIARENDSKKRVVVKVLSPEYTANIKDSMRFLQEAETIINLNHPNLIKGYDYFQSRKICYIVMEYLPGTSVMEMIELSGQISPKVCLSIARSIAEALKYMESKGVVHRDIKPEHIIITEDNVTKLIDFGILKTTQRPCSLTTVGVVLGTPYYMSPEQIYQSNIDIRSDIYCLGATMYHMLTGEVPFTGNTPIDVMQQRLFATPDPRKKNILIPQQVSQLVQKMMSKELKYRHNTVDELIQHIDEVLENFASPSIVNRKTKRIFPQNLDGNN
ncbi:protein kinase domain-containing protein [Candidatus Uabimicrobium amorphum]|uniref:Protein kinase n=1 Tax=Uabimicrobium amorphum TaxID=2596890 RepID=A0A5S9INQ8_UABAM|nr:protein kinase [Candidatus Uabimicrobium amorphum]BBM85283.1 protein kinase [Candidatus Uabimicrobium amorphum]